MTKPRTGRPPLYTAEQVIEAIGIVEKNGEEPAGETVKKALCLHLGVSGGINAQSLDREVTLLLEQRERTRVERLVAALPGSSVTSATMFAQQLKVLLVEHLAQEYDDLTQTTGKKLHEKDEDIASQRDRIRALLLSEEELNERIAKLEGEKHGLEETVETQRVEISGLKDQIARLQADGDVRQQMLAVLRETLGNKAEDAA
ncbi:MAG: hypothetical protein KDK29_11265 [Sedimentitalea sp.]|nr:hypothetical protein [Sedimentitalea sp.]